MKLSLVNCAFCRRKLKDEASQESGVGPICRGKMNSKLAVEIPSQWNDEIGMQLLLLSKDSFPIEWQETFQSVWNTVMTSKAANSLEAVNGVDWRQVVGTIIKLLALPIEQGARLALISCIKGLGYVSLADMLLKDVSKSPALVTVTKNYFKVQGMGSRTGHQALRALETFYSSHTSYIKRDKKEDLKLIIKSYYPSTNLDLLDHESIEGEKRKTVIFSKRANGETVWSFPWVSTSKAFYADLKSAVPYCNRQYHPKEKTWVMRLEGPVKKKFWALLKEHFQGMSLERLDGEKVASL